MKSYLRFGNIVKAEIVRPLLLYEAAVWNVN
jgi:hypothetical protein